VAAVFGATVTKAGINCGRLRPRRELNLAAAAVPALRRDWDRDGVTHATAQQLLVRKSVEIGTCVRSEPDML
jgi:hypothetical protein